MISLRECQDRTLVWSQPSAFTMDYELRAGEDVVARLAFRSSFGTLAAASAAEGTWTFKRVGFWQPVVTVRREGESDDLATFRNSTWSSGGTLQLRDGREYRADSSFWMTEFRFLAEGDRPLVVFRRISGVFHTSAEVDVRPEAREMAELPWIVPFGWYLTVMMQRDTAATSAIVS